MQYNTSLTSQYEQNVDPLDLSNQVFTFNLLEPVCIKIGFIIM